jgi:hypothetical protein
VARSGTKSDKKSTRPHFLLPAGGVEVSGGETVFRWPVAEDYPIEGGKLTPVGFKEFDMPLLDRDLFGSLARLSRGAEPSEKKARRWCCAHGVFFQKETQQGAYGERGALKNPVGDPLPLKTFREESSRARSALTLYYAVRNGRADLVRGRITAEPYRDLDSPHEPRGPFGAALVDGLDAKAMVCVDPEHPAWRGPPAQLPDDDALSIGLSALEARVQERVDLTARMVPDFGHARRLGDFYRPVPVLMPRSLLGAAWLQFLIYVSDFDRDWRLCANPNCGQPFLVERRDQTTCPGSAACRKGRQRAEGKG